MHSQRTVFTSTPRTSCMEAARACPLFWVFLCFLAGAVLATSSDGRGSARGGAGGTAAAGCDLGTACVCVVAAALRAGLDALAEAVGELAGLFAAVSVVRRGMVMSTASLLACGLRDGGWTIASSLPKYAWVIIT